MDPTHEPLSSNYIFKLNLYQIVIFSKLPNIIATNISRFTVYMQVVTDVDILWVVPSISMIFLWGVLPTTHTHTHAHTHQIPLMAFTVLQHIFTNDHSNVNWFIGDMDNCHSSIEVIWPVGLLYNMYAKLILSYQLITI